MKKSLLFLGILMASVIGVNAQSVVFQDDFESYDVGTNLAEKGYVLWEGGATVAAEEGTTNKIAVCTPSAQNFYFRRVFTLTEGKSYTFEVSTKSPDAKNHRVVAQVGTRNVQSELINSTTWKKTTLKFTVGTGETNVTLWIYSFPVNAVHLDNYKLIDDNGVATKINNAPELSVQMFPNPTNGELNIYHSARILSLNVYDIAGKLIETRNDVNREQYRMDLTTYQKGVYFLAVLDVEGKRITQKVMVH
jgi:hypothetical protein